MTKLESQCRLGEGDGRLGGLRDIYQYHHERGTWDNCYDKKPE